MAARRKDRVWMGIGVVASVVVIALAWLFLVNPQLGSRSGAEAQTADAQMQNLALQQKINKLRQESQNSTALRAQLDHVRDALPTAHQLDGFTRQVTAQAQKAGVTVVSITPASPVVVQSPAAPAPTTGETVDAAPTTTAPAAPNASGPAGQLYAIQVTLVTDGTPAKQQALLTLIQTQGPRAALVLSSKLAPDQATPGAVATKATTGKSGSTTVTGTVAPQQSLVDTWTMTTVLQVFVAPQSPQDQAALQTLAAPSK